MPKINFDNNDTDFEVVRLGNLGYTGAHIGNRTNLNIGQVYTRLRKAGVKLRDYRQGNNWVAVAVAEAMTEDVVIDRIKRDIRKHIKQAAKIKPYKKRAKKVEKVYTYK